MEVMLHIGCGFIAPDGWVNIDASWGAWLAKHPWLHRLVATLGVIGQEQADAPWPPNIKVHDITRGLPYPERSVSVVYASHLLEHLTRSAAREFVQECHRVLRPGGIIRLMVPDLEILARRYLEEKGETHPGDEGPANRFLEATMLSVDYTGLPLPMRLYRLWKDFFPHKWLYDADSLVALVRGLGFREVSRRGYLQSRIPQIGDVERADRFESGVCVEAIMVRTPLRVPSCISQSSLVE